MKYMLLIYSAESGWTQDEWTACTVESSAICNELDTLGQFIAASPLHPVATATTVRVRDGQAIITTGPFAETVEQLGGYYLIDVASLDEAIAIASRLPPAKKGTVEIRPLFHLDGLPAEKLSPQQPVETSMTRYMLLCYDDEAAWNAAGEAALHAAMNEAVALTHQLDAQRQYLSASPLQQVSSATCVRVRNGQRMVTDGPFAETHEVLGGYYIILAPDQQAAVRVAAQHSGARVGAVEVRPLFDLSSQLSVAK